MPDAPLPLAADDPRTLGQWTLTGRLGVGGMGRVYAATASDGRQAAIKTIHPHLLNQTDFRARFEREVAVTSKVVGPHVAEVYDSDTSGPMPWFALRYVTGPTLADHIARHGPLHGDDLRRLALGILQGLMSVHAVGITHRDLKPSNVILGAQAPVIVDFGISRLADMTSLTATAQTAGSAGWMSPEQLVGGPVGSFSDVFSWGLLMTVASTGHPAFGDGPADALTYRIVHTDPDLARVPPGLLPAVAASLSKDPAGRPATADLLAVLSGSKPATILQAPTQLRQVFQPTVVGGTDAPGATPRRRRGPFVAALVTAAVLATGAIGFVLLDDEPGRTGPAAVGQGPTTALSASPTAASSSGSTSSEKPTAPATSVPNTDPRLEMRIRPGTNDINDLVSFAADHEQSTVILDLMIDQADETLAKADFDESAAYQYLFVHDSAVDVDCPSCGAEVLITDLGTVEDAAFFYASGFYRLSGRFVVKSVSGPQQGAMSIALRAVPITG